MVADDHADGLAQDLAAEIVDSHLCRRHRALAGRGRPRAVHVGKHADFDDIIGDLRERRSRGKYRAGKRHKHVQMSVEHPASSRGDPAYSAMSGATCSRAPGMPMVTSPFDTTTLIFRSLPCVLPGWTRVRVSNS